MPNTFGNNRILLIALAMTLAVSAIIWPQLPSRSPDSAWYRMMATGNGHEVPRPFANRVLHTGLAEQIMDLTGCSVDTAFLALGLVSLFILLVALLSLLQGTGPWRLAVAILAIPLLFQLLRDNSLPDLLHAALTALVFLALSRRPGWVVPLLFLLGLARGSSALLAVVLAIVLWRDGRRRLAPAMLIATGAGLVAAWAAAGGGDTLSAHRIGAPFYFLFKVPFNLSRNVLGLELWVNSIDYCDPAWTWSLPQRLGRGLVDSVGICGLNAHRPLFLATQTLGLFGILPALLLGFRRRRGVFLPTGTALWIRGALYYGLSALILAPALGAATDRLLGYAWPAFWLATPLLLPPLIRDLPDPARALRRLLTLHLLCAWMLVLPQVWPESTALLEGLTLLALALNIAAYRTITAERELKVMYAAG